jgi:hypothetical protein
MHFSDEITPDRLQLANVARKFYSLDADLH